MNVQLLRYSDPDRSSLARVCAVYLNKPDVDNTKRPLRMIKLGHTSVFRGEHARFFFRTSLVVRDHLVRYTTANVMAAAGLRANRGDGWVAPFDRLDLLKELGISESEIMEPYNIALEAGVKPQDARYLVPCGVEVEYIMEFNFLTLMQAVFPQRLWDTGAQKETHEVVMSMWNLVYEQDPEFWNVVREEFGEEAIAWTKARSRVKKLHPDLYQEVMKVSPQGSMWD